MTQKNVSTPRPVTVQEQVQYECDGCLAQQKIDAAMGITGMFLEATKPVYICRDDEEPQAHRLDGRTLTPRESSAYHAALNFLERYMDAPGLESLGDAT